MQKSPAYITSEKLHLLFICISLLFITYYLLHPSHNLLFLSTYDRVTLKDKTIPLIFKEDSFIFFLQYVSINPEREDFMSNIINFNKFQRHKIMKKFLRCALVTGAIIICCMLAYLLILIEIYFPAHYPIYIEAKP